MKFTPIDRTTWERNSHYDYYTNLLKCGYSVTVSLDITKLHQQVKEKGLREQSFFFCNSIYAASFSALEASPLPEPNRASSTVEAA